MPQAKKNEADLWIPVWIGDYMKTTMFLTTHKHGAYFLLLLAYWSNQGALAVYCARIHEAEKIRETSCP